MWGFGQQASGPPQAQDLLPLTTTLIPPALRAVFELPGGGAQANKTSWGFDAPNRAQEGSALPRVRSGALQQQPGELRAVPQQPPVGQRAHAPEANLKRGRAATSQGGQQEQQAMPSSYMATVELSSGDPGGGLEGGTAGAARAGASQDLPPQTYGGSSQYPGMFTSPEQPGSSAGLTSYGGQQSAAQQQQGGLMGLGHSPQTGPGAGPPGLPMPYPGLNQAAYNAQQQNTHQQFMAAAAAAYQQLAAGGMGAQMPYAQGAPMPYGPNPYGPYGPMMGESLWCEGLGKGREQVDVTRLPEAEAADEQREVGAKGLRSHSCMACPLTWPAPVPAPCTQQPLPTARA